MKRTKILVGAALLLVLLAMAAFWFPLKREGYIDCFAHANGTCAGARPGTELPPAARTDCIAAPNATEPCAQERAATGTMVHPGKYPWSATVVLLNGRTMTVGVWATREECEADLPKVEKQQNATRGECFKRPPPPKPGE